jgi:GxxExxY protein
VAPRVFLPSLTGAGFLLYTESTERNPKTPKGKKRGVNMVKLLFEELSFNIRDALFQVHRSLGPGFREETYKRAAISELVQRQLLVEREKPIDIYYSGEKIDTYRLDLVVEEKIVIELKSVDLLKPVHEAQLLSYLKASGLRVGLLVNMGSERLQIIRKVY